MPQAAEAILAVVLGLGAAVWRRGARCDLRGGTGCSRHAGAGGAGRVLRSLARANGRAGGHRARDALASVACGLPAIGWAGSGAGSGYGAARSPLQATCRRP